MHGREPADSRIAAFELSGTALSFSGPLTMPPEREPAGGAGRPPSPCTGQLLRWSHGQLKRNHRVTPIEFVLLVFVIWVAAGVLGRYWDSPAASPSPLH